MNVLRTLPLLLVLLAVRAEAEIPEISGDVNRTAATLEAPRGPTSGPTGAAVSRGTAWLVAHQHADGGWGSGSWGADDLQATSDVATTVVATEALMRSGGSRSAIDRGVTFVVRAIEAAPSGPGLATPQGTQPQHKLGANVDTHFAARLLGEVRGTIGDPTLRSRVEVAYDLVLSKVQMSQSADGAFEQSGWAPVLSTSVATEALVDAASAGESIDRDVLARAERYQASQNQGGTLGAAGGGAGVALYAIAGTAKASAAYAGSRVSASPVAMQANLAAAKDALDEDTAALVRGFGSVGGEEMLAYSMLSDTLAERGGAPWTEWQGNIGTHLTSIQNADGSWSGHHCITSTVFVTAAAVLTLGAG